MYLLMVFNLICVLIVLTAFASFGWWLRSLRPAPVTERAIEVSSFCTPQSSFELTVCLAGEHGVWQDSHHMLARPETDTVKALMAVAIETYVGLYDEPPETYSCGLNYLGEDQDVEQYQSEAP